MDATDSAAGGAADGIAVDEAARTIRIRRTYAAGVERAWWAWTDPEAISRWWGPLGWVATVHEMDVRPGGRWRFEIAPVDRSTGPLRSVATYTAVRHRAELAYDDVSADETWRPDGTGTFPTGVTFAPTDPAGPADPGCTVVVVARFPDLPALRRAVELRMAEGYAETLDRLALLLDDLSGTHHPPEEKRP